ncbi:hypothetical protein Swit_3039 [Rhizorhabdus wittichii RW1]|uniref:DUF3100 domain-containing protein n=1 Tax=Rhizorhabdus wittichii (strain DSM 6014 / CCUG 31198 / JCM 15750 / NBRC 105917 / EY 4224 / RW1) TaxID=392499 RepID=A0A9J9HD26_RHIWR|nr:hypothetical protein Swit_3039 [Rhizorhabdus wittichii RW1]
MFLAKPWIMAAGAAALTSLLPALELPLGPTTMVVLPITYAFVLSLLLNIAFRRSVGHGEGDRMGQRFSATLPFAMLPFIVLLGAVVGHNWRAVLAAGPALILQEIGHFGGTVLLSFPIAVWLLRLGRETVGATFSIARESSVAIIAERYGLRSPEGTGVLAIYIIGTLAGTLIFSVIASLAAGLGFFDHRALAVSCGIGSASMTAACAGALGVADPANSEQILALAGASNLLSTIGGFYVALFVTLPLVDWLYRKFGSAQLVIQEGEAIPQTSGCPPVVATKLDWLAMSLASILIPAVAAKDILLALLVATVILALSWVSVLINRLLHAKLPAIAWASVLGLAFGANPATGSLVTTATGAFDALSLVMVPLTIAGFALGGQEARAARQVGWKLAIVSLAVFLGTFGGAALIAQATLGLH